VSKIITVNACCSCPFFQQTALGVIAAMVGKQTKVGPPLVGECGCPSESGLLHYPVGAVNQGEIAEARTKKMTRMKILDGNSLPRTCPLYDNQVVVTLKIPS
jgi:hypothetical protein